MPKPNQGLGSSHDVLFMFAISCNQNQCCRSGWRCMLHCFTYMTTGLCSDHAGCTTWQ
jgi:hypothetical protein